jgi:nitrite reductase/ring-hydroxylating ferredoxin subunit
MNIQLSNGYQIPKFSIGWYAIALTSELKPGTTLNRTFGGKNVVIFRTESGKVAVLDAYCRHMGAHLGHGGKVKGENIECPFHGFCFNGKGQCTKSGYDNTPHPKIDTYSYPLKVTGGVVFCYYHPQRETPNWNVEDLEDSEFTDFKFHTWELKSNVVEIAENSVDFGHFFFVHKYENPYVIRELQTNDHILTAAYGMHRKGKIGKVNEIDFQLDIFQQGLGLAVVNTEVPILGINSRHLVMACPKDGNTIYLRIGAAIKKIDNARKIHPLATLVPKSLLTKIIHQQVFKSYIHDVFQDFDVWKNKIYIHPPMLAKGDGPITKYRTWAAQFDPEFKRPQEALAI